MNASLAILIGVIALLTGYFTREAIHPSAKPTIQVRHDPGNSSRTRIITSKRHLLEKTLSIPESTERWLRIVALLEKATLTDMPGIAESVGFSNQRVIDLIGSHWFDLDPAHFFEASLGEMKRVPRGERANFACYKYLSFLAKKWPQQNLEAAITAFSQADPHRILGEYKEELLNHLVKIDLSKALDLSREWEFGLGSNHHFLREVVAADPAAAAHTILSHFRTNPQNNSRDPFNPFFKTTQGGTLIKTVAEIWGKSDPTAALTFANSIESDQGKYLQEKVLEQWARDDDAAAGHWLDRQAQDLQDKYRSTFIKAWAVEDPQGALSWCRENLQDPEAYRAAVQNLITGAMEGNLTLAAALIPKLTDQDQQHTVLNKVAQNLFSPNNEGKMPDTAVEWIRSLGDSRLGKMAAQSAASNWARNDPENLKAYLEEKRDFEYPFEVHGKLIEELTRRDPVRALEWANERGEYSGRLSHRAAEIWINQAPESAITWLRESQDPNPSHDAMDNCLNSAMTHKPNRDLILQSLSPENKAWLTAQFPEK